MKRYNKARKKTFQRKIFQIGFHTIVVSGGIQVFLGCLPAFHQQAAETKFCGRDVKEAAVLVL